MKKFSKKYNAIPRYLLEQQNPDGTLGCDYFNDLVNSGEATSLEICGNPDNPAVGTFFDIVQNPDEYPEMLYNQLMWVTNSGSCCPSGPDPVGNCQQFISFPPDQQVLVCQAWMSADNNPMLDQVTENGFCCPSGCTDPEATNYDPEAFICLVPPGGPPCCTYDTGSLPSGCMETGAINYDPEAVADCSGNPIEPGGTDYDVDVSCCQFEGELSCQLLLQFDEQIQNTICQAYCNDPDNDELITYTENGECCPPESCATKWKCNANVAGVPTCSEDPDGEFNSLEECESTCGPQGPEKIICYKCQNGNVVANQFPGPQGCPQGWTTDPDPCNKPLPPGGPGGPGGPGQADPLKKMRNDRKRLQELAGLLKNKGKRKIL